MGAHRWRVVVGIWSTVAVVFVVVTLSDEGALVDRARGGFGLAATLLVVVGLRQWRPEPARPWWLLAGAVGASALGDVLGGDGSVVGIVAVVAALAYLAAYPLCLASVFGLLGRDVRKRDAAVLVDGVVAAMALWLVVWLVVAWPALERFGVATVGWVPTVLYPPLDVLLLMVLARVGRGDQRTNTTWRLLMVAVGAMTAADLVATWSMVPGAEWLHRLGATGWVVAYAAIGAAAVVPDLATLRRDPQPDWKMVHPHLRFLGLGIALAVPPVLLVTVVDSPAERGVLAVVQLLMIGAVVFRAWITVDVATAATQTLGWRATHDPLTGLMNREAFLVELEGACHRARRGLTGGVLLFVDLDGFKAVNDDLGHDAGDEILVEVARRIEGVLRQSDHAARFGGDEFVVLCEDRVGSEQGTAAAGRLTDALGAPYTAGGRAVLLGASVGYADDFLAVADADELLRTADDAMYRAKAARKQQERSKNRGENGGENEGGSGKEPVATTRPPRPRSLAS